MKMNIKLDNIDSELMFKTFDVKIGKKRIRTPEKVSYPNNCISGINEIYRKFSIDSPRTTSLEKMLVLDSYGVSVNNQIKREIQENVNIFVVDYCDGVFPTQKHLEILSDTQYVYTDVIVTPIFSQFFRNDELIGDNLINEFIGLTNKYVEIVETLNNKNIMGLIPMKTPPMYIEDIFNNYLNHDITSFVFDFDGRAAEGNSLPKIRNIMRLMKESGTIEESLIYALNTSEGKFMKGALEIAAKDFLSTGFGIDILGLNHIQPRMPTEAWKKIAEMRRTYRLFNSGLYGYTKISESDLFSNNIMGRPGVTKYNNTEQCKEMNKLKDFLLKDTTIEPYFSTKKYVTSSLINKIKKLRNFAFK